MTNNIHVFCFIVIDVYKLLDVNVFFILFLILQCLYFGKAREGYLSAVM